MPKPTKKQDVRPYWLINYRHNDTNYGDTIGEDQMEGYLEQLLLKGVNPATIFISMLHQHNWLFLHAIMDCDILIPLLFMRN